MINVDSWSPLKEVWLGDCYPTTFYDHLENEVKDCFHKITEYTQHDLKVISKKLNELGVNVRRPKYDRVEDYINNGQLQKPHITPRDFYFMFNDSLYFKDTYDGGKPWNAVISQYEQDNKFKIKPKFDSLQLNGANIVKAGKDIYFDLCSQDDIEKKIENFRNNVYPHFADFRCHILFNGGHVDGCFAIIKPGLILATSYFTEYEKTFPGWEIIELSKPEFGNISRPDEGFTAARKWYLPNISKNDSFNQHIIKYALDWVGNYKETYFDINCLVVDEKNVMMLGDNDALYNKLEKKGINVHVMPFRTRTFWDGGLHCLTVDIVRESPLKDYFSFSESLIIHQ